MLHVISLCHTGGGGTQCSAQAPEAARAGHPGRCFLLALMRALIASTLPVCASYAAAVAVFVPVQTAVSCDAGRTVDLLCS